MFISIPMYLLLITFGMQRGAQQNSFLSFVFAAVATLTVILSFPIKQKLLQRSVDQQNKMLVQPAFVVAWAMCEVSALLGVIEYSVIGTRDYLVLFLLAGAGVLLHFPTRQHLLNATYKNKDW